ncbi:MAG: cytochrome ubiquinol oxidase subunit I, partial [Lacticaseibacillus paracasei]
PPVTLLFWTMHLMVYAGYFFTMFALFATIMLHRRQSAIEDHPKTLRTLGWVLWLLYLTFTSGWIVAEVGRYPFVVYGLLTQYDAVSPSVTVTEAGTSLALFLMADIFLVTTMIYISHRTVKRGLPQITGDYPEDRTIPDPFAKEAFSHA